MSSQSSGDEYFTATIKVEKIIPRRVDTGRGMATTEIPRRKGEVASIVVRAASIEKLKEKISGHVAIIDDDAVDTGDERTTRGE